MLLREAAALGFDAVRVTSPDAVPTAGERLGEFLAAGRHGDMEWMATHAERRRSPQRLWPDVRSIVMLGMSYAPETDPLEALDHPLRGAISVYAQGKDYHDILKGKLKQLAARLAGESGCGSQSLRRHRAGDGKAARRRRRARLAGQEHHAGVARARLVAVSRRHLHHRRAAARCRGGRPLRQLPPLPRRLPDGGIPGAVPARCAPLPRLPVDRAQGPHPCRVPPRHGQPRVRLRRLPRRVPVEQVRRRGARSPLSRTGGNRQPAARRAVAARRRAVPRALCRHAGETHRARPLPAQRAHRRRQLGRRQPAAARRSPAGRCLAAGARHGRMGDAPTRRRRHRRRRAPQAPRARRRQRCAGRMARGSR